MTKKLFVQLFVLLFALTGFVSCENPTDTESDDDKKSDVVIVEDPTLITLSGTEVTTATLTTAVTANISSGAELKTIETLDTVVVSSATTDDGYEIRCEIIFNPALDVTTATTLTFNTLMSYDSTIITVNTENSDNTADDLHTLGVSWHGTQAEVYSQEYTLATMSPDWGDTAWGDTTKKITKIEIYSSVTEENYLSPDFDTANISEIAFN